MAPANKRKAEDKSSLVAKGKKPATEPPRPAKRQRQETTTREDKSATAKDVEQQPKAERKPPKVSLLQEEERAFPRGGGGVLTPLEHKQIQVQATRDALFEESGHKRAKPEDMDSDFESGDEEEDEEARPAKKGKKAKSKLTSFETGGKTESRVRVEGLKFKVMQDGTMLW